MPAFTPICDTSSQGKFRMLLAIGVLALCVRHWVETRHPLTQRTLGKILRQLKLLDLARAGQREFLEPHPMRRCFLGRQAFAHKGF